MLITIRQERRQDHSAVFSLIEKAFKCIEESDGTEQFLVERLRQSAAFIPALSLVATCQNQIVGYILLTKIDIDSGNKLFSGLALAPVAVLPTFQNKGIGGQLILAAHEKAKDLGYQRIILIGHAEYYPRFGYIPAHLHNIQLPFEVPKEHAMVLGLSKNAFENVDGKVIYAPPFYD